VSEPSIPNLTPEQILLEEKRRKSREYQRWWSRNTRKGRKLLTRKTAMRRIYGAVMRKVEKERAALEQAATQAVEKRVIELKKLEEKKAKARKRAGINDDEYFYDGSRVGQKPQKEGGSS